MAIPKEGVLNTDVDWEKKVVNLIKHKDTSLLNLAEIELITGLSAIF